MDSNARFTYWETQVLTASPQKLRLMLIEGAIRHARQVLQLWTDENYDDAFTTMSRAQDIVFELVTSIQKNGSELNRTITSIYLFIYQSLVRGQLNRDRQAVEDALRVLAEERETWQQLCEKLPNSPSREERDQVQPQEITSNDAPAIHTPHLNFHSHFGGAESSIPSPSRMGFSADA